jgi:hypothetical protein
MNPWKKFGAFVATLLMVATLVVGISSIDAQPAEAQSSCRVTYIYGSATRTIGRDNGESYCDVQSRLRRTRDNGTTAIYYSGWKLYEARVSSWDHNSYYYGNICARNQARVRKLSSDRSTVYWTSGWYC